MNVTLTTNTSTINNIDTLLDLSDKIHAMVGDDVVQPTTNVGSATHLKSVLHEFSVHHTDRFNALLDPDNNPIYLRQDLPALFKRPQVKKIFSELVDDTLLPITRARLVLLKVLKYKFREKYDVLPFVGYEFLDFGGEILNDDPGFASFYDFLFDFPPEVLECIPTLFTIACFKLNKAFALSGKPPKGFDLNIMAHAETEMLFDKAWRNCVSLEHEEWGWFPRGAATWGASSQGSVQDATYMDYVKAPLRAFKATCDIPVNINRILEAGAQASEATAHTTTETCNLLDSLTQFLHKALGALAPIIQYTIEDAVGITELVMDIFGDISAGITLNWQRMTSYVSRIIRHVLKLSIAVVSTFFSTFSTEIGAVIQEVHSQGLSSTLSFLVVALTGVGILGASPTRAQMNSVMDCVRMFNLSVPLHTNLSSLFSSLGDFIPTCIKAWFMSLCPSFFVHEMLLSDYGEYLVQLFDFTKDNTLETLMYDNRKQAELADLTERGRDFVLKIANLDMGDNKYFALIREALRKLDQLNEGVAALGRANTSRVTPFCVAIVGKTQVGKSTLAGAIVRYLYAHIPEGCRAYTRKVATEYWDAYFGQAVTRYDDFLQDMQMKDAVELFDLVSPAPCPLKLASLDDASIGKKGTVFTSDMLILCSNVYYPQCQTVIADNEALLRRRHLLIEACVKPSYIHNGVIQYSPEMAHLYFNILDPVDNLAAPIRTIQDVRELLLTIKHAKNAHRIQQESCHDVDLNSIMVEYEARSQGLVELLERTISYGRTLVNEMIAYFNNVDVKKILLSLACVGAFVGTIATISHLYSSRAVAEGNIPSGDFKTARRARIRKPVVVEGSVVSEGSIDPSAADFSRNIAGRLGLFKVQFEYGKSHVMFALPIVSTVVLAPMHLFYSRDGNIVRDGTPITFVVGGNEYKSTFVSRNLTQLEGKSGHKKDVAIYNFGVALRPFKSIGHHFILEDDVAHLKHTPGCLVSLQESTPIILETFISPVTRQSYSFTPNPEKTMTLLQGWQYNASTRVGDCGAVLMQYNTKIPRKLLGIHVAGSVVGNLGFSEVITYECLMGAIKKYENHPQNFFEEGVISEGGLEPRMLLPEGNYTVFGTIPPSETVYQPTKSNIIPSLIHGKIFKPTTFPAQLNVSALENGISKYARQPGPIPAYKMDEAFHDLVLQVCRGEKSVTYVVSEEEAINGNPNIPYFDAMNMASSPGFPYCLSAKGGKKSLFEQVDGKWVVLCPTLRERLDRRLELAKKALRMNSRAVDFMKDERRPPHKMARLFTILPLDLNILMRRYFMGFTIHFYQRHLSFFSAIGMNVFSTEFTVFVSKLLKRGNYIFDGDFKSFDGISYAEFWDRIFKLVATYYVAECQYEELDEILKREDMRVRYVLWNELIHTITQASNVLYATHGGNPSGNTMTSIINTIMAMGLFIMAYNDLVPTDLGGLFENVTPFIYGDDNIFSVSEEVAPYFNFVSCREWFEAHGITYTSATKQGDVDPFKNLEEASFLKCRWRRDGAYYKPLLSEESIRECTNWITDALDPVDATISNCTEALHFAYFYGQKYFEELRNKIMHAFAAVPALADYTLPNYMFFNSRFLGEQQVFQEEILPARSEGNEVTEAVRDDSLKKVGVTTEERGVLFVEQTDVTQDVTKEHAGAHNSLASTSEPSWNIEATLSKYVRAGTYAWKTTDVAGTALKTFELPAWYVNKSTVFKNIFGSYILWKGNPKIRIELNGTRFHQGTLIAYWVPMITANNAVVDPIKSNKAMWTTLQHVFLDASKNSVAEFDIPWFYYRDYFALTEATFVPLGTVVIAPFNPLLVATGGSSSIYFTVAFASHNNSFHGPNVSVVSQGGVQSHNTYNMQGWSKVASATLPSNVRGDAFDVRANVSAMDKPNDTLSYQPMVRRAFPHQSHAVNIDHSQRMCLYPGGVTEHSPVYTGTSEDEMDLLALCKRMTYFDTAKITLTSTAGSTIWNAPITPFSLPNGAVPTDYKTKFLYLPLLSYLALPFDFWRGSLRVRFNFVMSAFHTAKMAFCLNYGYRNDQLTSSDKTSQYVYYFEINAEKRCFEFEIPWISPTQWKRVCSRKFDDTIVLFNTLCSLGTMSLVVVNQLVAPSNVANEIAVNIFLGGGDDFELNSLTFANSFYPAVKLPAQEVVLTMEKSDAPAPSPTATTQTSVSTTTPTTSNKEKKKKRTPRDTSIQEDDEEEEDVVSQGNEEITCDRAMSTLPKTQNTLSNCMTEKYTSIKDILKRGFIYLTVNDPRVGYFAPNEKTPRHTMLFNPALHFSAADVQNTRFSYFACMYRANRGSFRFKAHVTRVNRSSNEYPAFLPQYIDARTFYTPQLPRSMTNSANADTYTASVHGLTTGNALAFSTNVSTACTMGPPVEITDYFSPISDIEIPYQQINNMRLIPWGVGSEAGISLTANPTATNVAWADANCHGTIALAIMADGDVDSNFNIQAYFAAGDDMRLFGLLGPLPLLFAPQFASASGTGRAAFGSTWFDEIATD